MPTTTVWGTYPAMSRPLRGSSASWSPFLFAFLVPRDEEKDCHFRLPAQKYRPQRKTNREVVMRLEGGCYCGEVRYVAEGDPMMQAQCHCRECQYISGGAPNTFIAMPAAGFSYITGQPKQFTRKDLERAVRILRRMRHPSGDQGSGTARGDPEGRHPGRAKAVPSADGDLHLRHAGVPRDPGGHEDIREAAGALGAPISGNPSCPGLPRLRGRSPLRRGEGPGMNVLGAWQEGRGRPGQARP